MHPRQSFSCLRPKGACNVGGVDKSATVPCPSLPDQLCSNFGSQSRAYHGNICAMRADHHCCRPVVGCMVCMQEDPRVSLFLVTNEARDDCDSHSQAISTGEMGAFVFVTHEQVLLMEASSIPRAFPVFQDKLS